MPMAMTKSATMPMPAKGAGMTEVNRGISQMMPMVSATSPSISASGAPVSQAPFAMPWPADSADPGTWNCDNCAMKITMARPLTNPSITGCGTSRMNLPR